MATKAIDDRNLVVAVSRPTIAVLLALSLIALPYLSFGNASFIASYFFLKQDLPVVIALAVCTILMRPMLASPAANSRVGAAMDVLERVPVWAIAGFVFAAGLLAVWLVFGSYPLSMDEFWARADGVIITSGHAMAAIPLEWRGYAHALQPIFARVVPGQGLWASTYLPVNAALQGLLGPLASPLMAAISVLIAADLARRLLPEHPTAPVICALLMASSSQLLITAGTPYAMTAHLAFNLAWLWLFVHSSRVANLAALPVAVLAIGLHQAAFFPMFAVPFLFEAFLSGRRGAACLQGAVIVAAFLCWSAYDAVVFWWLHVTPGGATGTARMMDRALAFISAFGFSKIALMALNLIRWTVWQNLLAVPLLLVTAWPAIRNGGVWRAMVAGIALTILVVTAVMGFQGHGWGYRYAFQVLGSLALIAADGVPSLVSALGERRARRWLMAGCALALLVQIPLRLVQTERFVRPFAAGAAYVRSRPEPIVIVHGDSLWYGDDLVRNDPYLARPIVLRRNSLTPAAIEQIERAFPGRVRELSDAELLGLGMTPMARRR